MSEEEDLDVNDANNYSCTLAKNGTHQYRFGKNRIKREDIPKAILAGLICAQKGEALVSERAQAFQKLTTGLPGLQKKAARLERKLDAAEAKKKGVLSPPKSPRKSPPKSPRKSPSAKGPAPPARKESTRRAPNPPQRKESIKRSPSKSSKSPKRSPGRKSPPKKSLPPNPQEELQWLRYYWQATRPTPTELAKLVMSYRAVNGQDPVLPM